MSDTPETIAAILAEMRREAGAQTNPSPLYRYADRIEAAVEREREEVQSDLADAHDAIARLESELAETRRERDILAAERAMDASVRTHIPHETVEEVLAEMKRGLHCGRGYDIDDVNRLLRDWAVRIGIANERSSQAKRCFTAKEVYEILKAFHNEHYSVFPRDELTEKLCHAFHDQFVADANKTRQ